MLYFILSLFSLSLSLEIRYSFARLPGLPGTQYPDLACAVFIGVSHRALLHIVLEVELLGTQGQ